MGRESGVQFMMVNTYRVFSSGDQVQMNLPNFMSTLCAEISIDHHTCSSSARSSRRFYEFKGPIIPRWSVYEISNFYQLVLSTEPSENVSSHQEGLYHRAYPVG
mmetsp:Transcript_4707/g.7330  ORF Transcript_4707/g.7330 Transcript_4707/m.7330 type:complete len:104 (+) Transcript_4707:79-390(+)